MLAIFTIQALVNYLSIQSNIQSIKDKDFYLQEEIDYLQHFQKPYLWSVYYRNHHIHDMGLITSGEYIIKIDYLKNMQNPPRRQSNQTIAQESTIPIDPQKLTPIQAWQYLRKQIIQSS